MTHEYLNTEQIELVQHIVADFILPSCFCGIRSVEASAQRVEMESKDVARTVLRAATCDYETLRTDVFDDLISSLKGLIRDAERAVKDLETVKENNFAR